MDTRDPITIYEDVFVPALMAPCAERLVDLAAPQPGDRVLDIACGTGIVARTAASRLGSNGRVTGLDAAPAMVDAARRLADRAGLHIDWHVGRAEALPLADATFDLVFCQAALMFFDDRATALAEMRRVLAPGGRVAIAVFQGIECHPFYAELDALLRQSFGLSGVGDIFACGDLHQLQDLLHAAGFSSPTICAETIVARYADPSAFLDLELAIDTAVIPALQHLTADERGRVIERLRDDIEPTLRRFVVDDAVVLPMYLHVALAARD